MKDVILGDNTVQACNHFFMDESISRTTPHPAQRIPVKGSSEMGTRSGIGRDAWSCAPPNDGQGLLVPSNPETEDSGIIWKYH